MRFGCGCGSDAVRILIRIHSPFQAFALNINIMLEYFGVLVPVLARGVLVSFDKILVCKC